MKVEYINPFLAATKNVIETMAFTPIKPGKPEVKKGKTTWGEVSGIIGMASKNVKGSMILSFEANAIIFITNQMLGENFQALNKDVIDCVGELTNMICGGAKQKLIEMGLDFDMASPVTISGKNIQIHQISEGPTITVPFEVQGGKFVIEANMAERK